MCIRYRGFVYQFACYPRRIVPDEVRARSRASILLVTKNEEERGLGVALPQGALNLFEPSARGPQLVNQNSLRDYAVGQNVELTVGQSQEVAAICGAEVGENFRFNDRRWFPMEAEIANDNNHPVTLRLDFGVSGQWDIRWGYGETRIKDGRLIGEITLPANSETTLNWRQRSQR